MDCFNPSQASGLFTLVAVVLAFVGGALGYRWLNKNRFAELSALETAAKEFDDKRRG